MTILMPGEWTERPTVFVLTGIPGSGKSTWAQLQVRGHSSDYQILSTDYFLEFIAKENGENYTWAFENHFGEAKARMDKQAETAFKEKKNVICDQTHMGVKSRRRAMARASKDYHKISVVFQTTPYNIAKRVTTRAAATGKMIPNSVIRRFEFSYEEPTLDEGFEKVFFNTGTEYEDAIEKMLQGEKKHAGV